jgi:DNA-binding NarL/FixJ family response regulator
MQKRILIVDNHASIRGLIRVFMESRSGIEVCGEAANGQEGIEQGVALRPDLIIMDFSMPRINGLQAALILHATLPETPIILFTFDKDVVLTRLANNSGVSSVISKFDQLTVLADEVDRLTGQLLV